MRTRSAAPDKTSFSPWKYGTSKSGCYPVLYEGGKQVVCDTE